MSPRAVVLVALSTAALCRPAVALGQTPATEQLNPPAEQVPAPLQGIDIEDERGAQLPVDLAFTDQTGRAVTLGDYLDKDAPLVLVLAYFRCPSLCSVVISQLTRGLEKLDWTAGKQYHVLIVSFDPRDTVDVAAAKRESYLAAYGRDVGDRGFDFLVGDGKAARRLADVVGFHYRWDEAQQQFAHAAGAFVFTGDGRLSRTLWGLNLDNARDLRLALVEASQGRLGTVSDRVLLYCYHWDPHAKGFVLATRRLLSAGAALTLLCLGGFLVGFWIKERRKSREG